MKLSKIDIPGIGVGSVVRRRPDGSYECIADEVAVEEPLEIRVANEPLAVTMRTPGDDVDLAAGFLLSEAIVRTRRDVQEIAPCTLPSSAGNVVNVTLSPEVQWSAGPARRFGTISSSCGLCGKTSIEFVRQQFAPLAQPGAPCLAIDTLLGLYDQLQTGQGNFARTGGIHAAGIFGVDGKLVVVREDIGRHNAVDKAIGRMFLENRLPLHNHVLLVSGRCSLEIVQKGLAAGIPIIASVSAPSTLAVNFARDAGQTLVGFLRPPTFNVYAHVERLALD